MSNVSDWPPSADNAPFSVEPLDRLRERLIARIAPFFSTGLAADDAVMRDAASQLLACYDIANGRELQLSAQISVLDVAVLACLSLSMTERDMPVNVVLRMRTNAVTLSNMAEKARKALEARQRQRRRGQGAVDTQFDEGAFNAAIGKARDMLAYARTKLEAHQVGKALATAPAAAPVPLPPLIAQEMTPTFLAGPARTNSGWAADLAELARAATQSRH